MTFNEFHEEVVAAAKHEGIVPDVFGLNRVRGEYSHETKSIKAVLYVVCIGTRNDADASEVFIVSASFSDWKEFSDFVATVDEQWKAVKPKEPKGEVNVEVESDEEPEPIVTG
jgi:hypothetical protein